MPAGHVRLRRAVSTALRAIARRGSGDSGAATAELAMVMPVFALMLFGIVKFGLVMNNYIEVTEGVRVAGRQFASERQTGSGTIGTTPVTDTSTAFYDAAPNLVAADVTLTYYVGATAATVTACTTNTTCAAAITTAGEGGVVEVKASYSVCDLQVVQYNFAPNCSLASNTYERIE